MVTAQRILNLQRYITRAEFATIAARFSDVVYSGTGKFGDVGGHWSENYVNIAAEEAGYKDMKTEHLNLTSS